MFERYDLGGLILPNRIVMAPMTRSRVGPGDVPSELNAEYYRQRSSAGLIVSEGLVVSPDGKGYLFTPGLHTGAQIDGWRRVVDVVHRAGGRIFAQLWHVGRVAHMSTLPAGQAPLSSTDLWAKDLETFGVTEDGKPGKVTVSRPRAMIQPDLDSIAAQFAQAARNAERAGFDGIEILAGNGYVFEQFLNAACNTRRDRYGGRSPGNRARLLLETIDALRAAIAGRLPIGVRLSPFGFFNAMPEDDVVEETYFYLAGQLRSRDVAYAHFNDEPVSIGHLNAGDVDLTAQSQVRRLIPGPFLSRFKNVFGGTVILCGGLDVALATQFLATGCVDLVAFGTSFIANPDLPARLQNGWPLSPPDPLTFYGGNERGYTDYPAHSG
ncbi:MAG: alkene reductase [Rhodospirillaceae bacterium]|nr:alkene reductase [Rhodospirillaceae bacterium]